jgi:hypothetical protein
LPQQSRKPPLGRLHFLRLVHRLSRIRGAFLLKHFHSQSFIGLNKRKSLFLLLLTMHKSLDIGAREYALPANIIEKNYSVFHPDKQPNILIYFFNLNLFFLYFIAILKILKPLS